MKVDPTWKRVDGRITSASSRISDGDTTYTPVVGYSVNGRQYQIAGQISSSAYPSIGATKEVAYNPSRPDQTKTVEPLSASWFVYLFPAIGIACICIALVAFTKTLRRSRVIKNLVQTGQKIQGVITEVQSTGSNNSNSYKILVLAVDTNGMAQNHVSDRLTGLAGLAMADFQTNPIPIDVYIDISNPQRYYVDIDDIPGLTTDRISQLVQSALKQREAYSSKAQNPISPSIDSNPTKLEDFNK